MMGNYHVRFLGRGKGAERLLAYPILKKINIVGES
jgi:hypothetical protein